MTVAPRRNTPHDLRDHFVPEASNLGFVCVRLPRVAAYTRECKLSQTEAAHRLSRLFTKYHWVAKEADDKTHLA
jgi:hypothetical protein